MYLHIHGQIGRNAFAMIHGLYQMDAKRAYKSLNVIDYYCYYY